MKTSIFTNSNECIAETVFPGDNSRLAPPDPISNSAVKRTRADDSVGFPHVKVGYRQALFFPKNHIFTLPKNTQANPYSGIQIMLF